MSFYQGDEEQFTFTFPFDSSNISKLVVTFIQDESVVLEKETTSFSGDWSADGNKVTLSLRESETLGFSADDGEKHEKKLFIQICGVVTIDGASTNFVNKGMYQTTVKKRWHTGTLS